jgi:hypothetical protein
MKWRWRRSSLRTHANIRWVLGNRHFLNSVLDIPQSIARNLAELELYTCSVFEKWSSQPWCVSETQYTLITVYEQSYHDVYIVGSSFNKELIILCTNIISVVQLVKSWGSTESTTLLWQLMVCSHSSWLLSRNPSGFQMNAFITRYNYNYSELWMHVLIIINTWLNGNISSVSQSHKRLETSSPHTPNGPNVF